MSSKPVRGSPQPPALAKSGSPPSRVCPPRWKYFVLALVAIHLAGVLAEPLRFFSRSEVRTAPEFALLHSLMKPYAQWMYLNHGYFFFAPNPGPGHLLRISMSNSDSTTADSSLEQSKTPSTEQENRTLQFPDRHVHWPRLLYHRYFMFAEFYTTRYAPKQVTEELKKDVEFMKRWSADRELYTQLQSSVIASIEHSHGQAPTAIHRIERLLPDMNQVLRESWPLDDDRLVVVLAETMQESTNSDELPAKQSPDAPNSREGIRQEPQP